MYKIIIPKSVVKELKKIDHNNQQRIWKKIKELEAGNFLGDKSLKGKHAGKFKKRMGKYSIIYLKENDIILITLLRIAHRKEAY